MKNRSCTCFKKKSSNEQYLVIICNSNKKNETDNPRWTVVSNQKIKVVVCLLFGMTKQLSQGSKPMIDARRLEGATLQLWTDMQGVSWQCPGHLICSCVDDPSFVSIFAKAFLVSCGWTEKKKKRKPNDHCNDFKYILMNFVLYFRAPYTGEGSLKRGR